MADYISLHNHTTFSIMDSLSKPIDLFNKAKEFGQKAIGITDHGTLAGAWDCLKASRKTGVKLIIGCEMNFIDNLKEEVPLRHIILLAKNAAGYRNLLTLNKLGYDNFIVAFKKAVPRIDWELLEKHHEGMICTTACGNGIVSQLIARRQFDLALETARRLQGIFGEDLALELQPHQMRRKENAYSGGFDQAMVNLKLKQISEETGIKCIAANNSHYLEREHHAGHDVLLAIGSGQPIGSGQRLSYNVSEFYHKGADEVEEFFTRWEFVYNDKDPQFIQKLFSNTVELGDKCEFPEWIDPKYSNPSGKELPEFPVKDQPDYKEFLDWAKGKGDAKEDVLYLRYRCENELKRRFEIGELTSATFAEYRDRVEEELDVFVFHGFCSYMLIVANFLDWARENGIPIGPGRGSCGGCLVAYLLGIHKADPFKYDLIFARFHNKEKTNYPDLDIDVAPSGRELVHNYIRGKYGEEYVAHVSNVNTISPKVYARDISRAFEFGDIDRSKAAEIGNEIADSIPSDISSVESALTDAPLFAEYAKQYPELAEYSKLIGGKARNWSTHAAGIVIGKRPLTGLVPVRKDIYNQFALEYDKTRAEEAGMIKIDTLSIQTLDIIKDCYDIIKVVGKTPPPEPFDYEQYDEATYDLISRGDTFCVFQLAGTAVPLCKAVKPKSIKDIALISALLRPSAKAIVNDLIRVRNGEAKIELLHPLLHRAFAGTYGFGLYEECLMYVAQDCAGWDLHKADNLRKMTKDKGKYPDKVAVLKKEFIEDAQKNKGLSEELATKIWTEVISTFGSYGFNSSHAVIYSLNSYKTAYLKAHYPLEFLVANLMSEVKSNQKQAKENIVRIKDEIRALNIKIAPPDINTSTTSYKIIDDKTLMTGLDALKYIGSDSIPELLEKRPFSSFEDLMARVDAKKVRAPAIQAMAASGSLDSFGIDRKLMFLYASDYRKKLQVYLKKPVNKRPEKFEYPWPNEVPWDVRETYALEEYYMGEGMAGTVWERYEGFFETKAVPFPKMAERYPYCRFSDNEKEDRKRNSHILGVGTAFDQVAGIITKVWSFKVKKEDSPILGQTMARLVVQDPWGNVMDVLCFPEAWEGIQDRVTRELSGGKLKVEPGLAISFNGTFQWESQHQYSFVMGDIVSCKGAPALPADLKSKKVKMPRAKKSIEKEDIEEMDKEDLIEKLDDEMVECGLDSMDEEESFDPFE